MSKRLAQLEERARLLPRRVSGRHVASTTTAIERQPFRWDANGFYRRLGIPVDAARVEVAHAYMDLDGYRSVDLTEAAMVLLDRHARRRYDSLPLGVFWVDRQIRYLMMRLREPSGRSDDDGWAVYADAGVDEAAVHPHWWGLLACALDALGVSGSFAVGVTRESDPYVGTVGQRTVIFLPEPLAVETPGDYCSGVAEGIRATFRSH